MACSLTTYCYLFSAREGDESAHDETIPNPREEEPPQDHTPCNVQQDEMDSTHYVQEDSPATVNAERESSNN